MDRALFAAASGMAAQQQNIETIADDLANADVSGFKGSTRRFAELVSPGASGLGTVATGTQVVFAQGKLAKSGGPFDVAIEGPGFFAVEDASGRRLYTRDGAFQRESDGRLRNGNGLALRGVRIPSDALSATVTDDGTVRATFTDGVRAVGHIRIVEFPAQERLRATGGAVFEAVSAAGRGRSVAPGTEHGPKLHFGMLERSNVSIVEAMMQMLSAQRAYEANAKGVQAADEMLRIANNLQRG